MPKSILGCGYNESSAHLSGTIAAITYASRALSHRSFLRESLPRHPFGGMWRCTRGMARVNANI